MNQNWVVKRILNYASMKKYKLPYRKLPYKKQSIVRKYAVKLVRKK
jgi:hypothetical protein